MNTTLYAAPEPGATQVLPHSPNKAGVHRHGLGLAKHQLPQAGSSRKGAQSPAEHPLWSSELPAQEGQGQGKTLPAAGTNRIRCKGIISAPAAWRQPRQLSTPSVCVWPSVT